MLVRNKSHFGDDNAGKCYPGAAIGRRIPMGVSDIGRSTGCGLSDLKKSSKSIGALTEYPPQNGAELFEGRRDSVCWLSNGYGAMYLRFVLYGPILQYIQK